MDKLLAYGFVQRRNGLAWYQKRGQIEQIQEYFVPITERKAKRVTRSAIGSGNRQRERERERGGEGVTHLSVERRY